MVERIEILEKTIERTEAESVTSILNRADELYSKIKNINLKWMLQV